MTVQSKKENFFDAVRNDPEISPENRAYWLAMEPRKETSMDGLTEGRIVHYVLNEGRYKGEHRAAIVSKVWRNGDGTPPANGVSNLTVFTDAANDDLPTVFGRSSVLYDADEKPGTWHWIEKA